MRFVIKRGYAEVALALCAVSAFIGFDTPGRIIDKATSREGSARSIKAGVSTKDNIESNHGTGVLRKVHLIKAQHSMHETQKRTNNEGEKSDAVEPQSQAYGDMVEGTLSIYVVNDAETWRGGGDEGDQYLGTFTGPEWKAIFFDALNCPRWEEYTGEGSFQEHNERQRRKFEQSIPEFPMLGRIYYLYDDVRYKPEDVKCLRDECLTGQSRTTNPQAIKALKKLALACEEALKVGRGLFLISD